MIVRRIFGFIIFLIGMTVLILSLLGAFYAGRLVDSLTGGVTNSLMLATQSLDTAGDTLALARDSISAARDGLGATAATLSSTSQSLTDSQTMIDNISGVITQEVPEGIEGVQTALPNIIQVAGIIDRTLVTLSSVGIDRTIPLPFGGSFPLRFDLGIDYEPEVPFDESLRQFETSLVGLPESLRGLEDDLRLTNDNLATLAADFQTTGNNLAALDGQIEALLPLLDQYTVLVGDLQATIAGIESNLAGRMNVLRIGLIGLLIGLGLTQLASIYLGWELMSGLREPVRYETLAVAPPAPAVPWPLTGEPPTYVETRTETRMAYEPDNE
jgi:hypothetical protein